MKKQEYINKKISQFTDWDDFFDQQFETDALAFGLYTAIGRIKAAKNLKKALYVHVFNKDVDIQNLFDSINDFMEIQGEVCCSEIGDEQFTTRRNKVAVILEGQATAQFSCDCWSKLLPSGKRYATRRESETDRSETWVVPANCKLWGLAYSGSATFEKLVETAAFKLGCSTLKFHHVDKQRD